jgi:hypothetical protein
MDSNTATTDTDVEPANLSIALSENSSFENNVVVEEWKANINRNFTLEKLPPSRSNAALMIQTFYRSYRNRQTFKTIKSVLAQAEETITKKVLKQVNPSEAHLINDPSLRARVRFRLGGSSWPPIVLYKIYTSVPFRYIDGKVITSNYGGKIENQYIYTRREYQQFIACLDKKPVRAGGRGNSWRPLFRSAQKVHSINNNTRNYNDSNSNRNALMSKGYSNEQKMSYPFRMRSSIIKTRLGAGGGMVGPKHLIGKEKQRRNQNNINRDTHATVKFNARWQSSIPKRRPGTTTGAGRRLLREGIHNNIKDHRRRKNRPSSASASRSRNNSRGISSLNNNIKFDKKKKNMKSMRRSKSSSSNRKLRLKGSEMIKLIKPSSSIHKSPSNNKMLTPSKYRAFVNKSDRPSSGKKRSGKKSNKLARSLTSWDTIPESEVNDLYAWSTALNIDQDLEKLLWVKTSPS